MQKLTAFVKTLLLTTSMFFCAAATADTETRPVWWFSDFSESGGWSHLTRTEGMILLTLEAAGLVPGDAHTLWWIVFNTPDGCSNECGEDDIFNADGSLNVAGVLSAGISISNASGNIAKADGTLEFGARLIRSGEAGGHQVLLTPHDVGGDETTAHQLYATAGADAEVHVIVQSHGQARGGKKLLQQLAYVEANCTPVCEDRQVATHMP